MDTSGRLEPEALTIAEGDPTTGVTYAGTHPRLARWWLQAVPRDPEHFTFVDMGSGKGRVLLFAAQHGFSRVIGVEFAEELHLRALENAHAAEGHGPAFEPVLGDAGAFEFPLEPLVVHFNNPFLEPVMVRVLANLTRSYESKPRPVVVVYQQMTVEGPRHRTRNLELLEGVPFLRGGTLAKQGWLDRRMLRPFTVRVFRSPEADTSEP
jgi:SAM-dependent methyltransferase